MARLTAISYALPNATLTHAELCKRFGAEVMEKVAAASGIRERRIAAPDECASDLAFAAAKRILEKHAPDSFDALFFATQTPDYLLPSTACILQNRLGLKTDAAAFDINLGCTQFVYGLATAAAFVDSSMAEKVLLLCGDTPSKLINPKDKSAVALFSDAACACVVERAAGARLGKFSLGTDGGGYADLICPASGMRRPPRPEDYAESDDGSGNVRAAANLFVDGLKIFSFAFKTIPQCVEQTLKRNALSKTDIDLFVFHQAGEMIVRAAAQRLKLDAEKVYLNVRDIGNCGGSSPAIAIADAVAEGRIKRGMKVLVCAFGVGLSWGGTVLDFADALPSVYPHA